MSKSRWAHTVAPAAMASAMAFPAASAPAFSPPTFEEVMTQGVSFGEARFSPDGRRLLYTEKDNLARGRGGQLSPLRGVFLADLATGQSRKLAVPGDASAAFEACATWSPDGRGAVFLEIRGGVPTPVYVDIATGRETVFPAPAETFCSGWVGNRLVYVSRRPGSPPQWSWAAGLANLARRWKAAWETDVAQVTVHSSNPDFPTPSLAEQAIAVADPATGKVVYVADGTYNVVLAPSPDGRRFAAVRHAEPLVRALDRMSGHRGEVQVYVLTPNGARLEQAIPGFDVGKGAFAWSPDGKRLLVGGRASGAAEASLMLLDPEHGGRQDFELPPGVSLISDDAASADSLWPLGWVAGRPVAIGQTQGSAERAADQRLQYGAASPRAMRLFSFGVDGKAIDLTAFAHQSVNRFGAAPDGDGLVAVDGGLWAVSPGHAPRRITPPDLQVVAIAQARSSYAGPEVPAVGGGRAAVLTRAAGGDRLAIVDLSTGAIAWSGRVDGQAFFAPKLETLVHVEKQGWASRLRTEGALSRTVAEANSEWRDRAFGKTQSFTYRVGDRELVGWILLPAGYAGGRLPAITWIYGGTVYGGAPPTDALPGEGVTPFFSGQLWAAQGYAVIFPSCPIGRGFNSDIPDELSKAAVAAVDAAADRGWVDPARVGIIGQSFGGYSTAAVLSRRSDRFRAGVAVSGTYDEELAWGSRRYADGFVDADNTPFTIETLAYVEKAQVGLGSPPWVDPEAYRRNSPFYQAGAIKSPLLIFHGDLDLGPTSLQQGERFYAALRRTGNAAELVRYWGQGHAQRDPWAVRDEWRRAQAWFGRYVRDATPAPAGGM